MLSIKLTPEQKFARSLVFGLSIAASLSLYFGHTLAAGIIGAVALLHLLLAILRPKLLAPSRWLLEGLVKAIGHIIAVTVLSLFYYTALTPFSLFWKLIGKDSLRPHSPHWRTVPGRDNDPETLRRLF